LAETIRTREPLACNLNAIPADRLERYRALSRRIWPAIQETVELPDGYALRLPDESNLCLEVAEFMSLERLCCPFFRLALELEPHGGPMWLRVTGGEAVKTFLREALQAAARS